MRRLPQSADQRRGRRSIEQCFRPGQRFDFATFNTNDGVPTRGAADERGQAVTLQSIANSRSTVNVFGAGFYEMLARQITADLQAIRDAIYRRDVAGTYDFEYAEWIKAYNGAQVYYIHFVNTEPGRWVIDDSPNQYVERVCQSPRL